MIHLKNVKMHNIPKVDELKVSWYDNICELIHKKCHYKSYHNDIKYHTTLDTIFIVVCARQEWPTWSLMISTTFKGAFTIKIMNSKYTPLVVVWDCSIGLSISKKLFLGTIELSVKTLKEGRNHGFDPSLRKLSMTSLLACRVLKPILKVGGNVWDLHFPPLKLSENCGI